MSDSSLANDVAPPDSVHSATAKKLKRDKYGHFIKEGSGPSLVSSQTDKASARGDPAPR